MIRQLIAIGLNTFALHAKRIGLMIKNTMMYELFNKCLCEELLRENVPNISQDAIDEIWEKVKPNPWDAVIMYHLLRLKNND